MSNYNNPNGTYPPGFNVTVPGISLPDDFALEAADRTLTPGDTGQKPQPQPASTTDRVRFPIRKVSVYGEALARLVGAFSGPGFNIIFRPHSAKTKEEKDDPSLKLPDIDLLELNLTHELWKFPAVKAGLGEIPNRVAKRDSTDTKPRDDAILSGIPYTQLVRDVTLIINDKGVDKGIRIPVDRLGVSIDPAKQGKVNDIHFEPGLFVHVPHSLPVSDKPTISRMASIPHGTTINAQGAAAIKKDGNAPPDIPFRTDGQKEPTITASTPFFIDNTGPVDFSPFFDLKNDKATRLPQKLGPFTTANLITKEMIQDPNALLRKHNEGKTFSQVIQFTVSTVPSQGLEKQACPHLAAREAMSATDTAFNKAITATTDENLKTELRKAQAAIADALQTVNGSTSSVPQNTDTQQIIASRANDLAPAIGSANIAFLDGNRGTKTNPNARTGKVESTFWISTVVYNIKVDKKFVPSAAGDPNPKVLKLDPVDKDKFAPDTVPSFVFPVDQPVEAATYKVEATQIQYSQNVNLLFNTLVWPHISVATVIPVRPVLVNFAEKLS